MHLRFGYVHSDQLCTLAHLPVGAVSFCLCFQGSEAMDLNTFSHEMFFLHTIFTGGFKSSKQGHNWNFESKTTELLISVLLNPNRFTGTETFRIWLFHLNPASDVQVQLINVLDLHLLRPRLEFFNLSLLHRHEVKLVCVSYVMADPGVGRDFNLPVTSERCSDTNFDKNDYAKLF